MSHSGSIEGDLNIRHTTDLHKKTCPSVRPSAAPSSHTGAQTLMTLYKIPIDKHIFSIGYDFSDEWSKKCSYYHALTSMGKMTDNGTADIDINVFMNKKFILPFSLTPSINHLEQKTAEKVQQSNMMSNSDLRLLYLKFKSELTTTLKITCIFLQHRSLVVDNQKSVYKVIQIFFMTYSPLRSVIVGFECTSMTEN